MINLSYIFTIVLSTFFASEYSQAKQILVDQLSAIVGEKPVFRSDIEKKARENHFRVSFFPARQDDSAFTKSLQDEINWLLIEKKFEELEIEVTDDMVQAQIRQTMESHRLTERDLLAFLAKQGKTRKDYEEDMRQQMAFMRFQGRVILPKINVSENDLRSYYLEKSQADNTTAVELDLRQLVLSKNRDTNHLQEVMSQLKNNIPFIEAQRLYSDGSNSAPVSTFHLKDLAPSIQKVVQSLKKGQYSQPVELGNQLVIFYIEDKRAAQSAEFQQVKKELEAELRAQNAQTELMKWLQETRQKENIRILSTEG